MAHHTSNPATSHGEEDLNVVELWTTPDLPRVIAGVFAGCFAALVMSIFAAVYGKVLGGFEITFPWKYAGTLIVGGEGTEYGNSGMGFIAILSGLVLIEIVGGFLGAVFAHFVKTNHKASLAAMGVVWSLFSWIFIWCLFLQSFNTIRWAGISAGAAFPVTLVFGLALGSVSFFDTMVRGRSSS